MLLVTEITEPELQLHGLLVNEADLWTKSITKEVDIQPACGSGLLGSLIELLCFCDFGGVTATYWLKVSCPA